ncbi:MAG: hypothetical protein CMH81_05205 [Nitrospiraceae bacterium]|nr:hypothetical protein [Nitrospiraceae bacterium]
MSLRPSLQAIVVCDTIIEDRNTGKKSLVGIFTHLASKAFPCNYPSMSIYFCVTDAEGDYTFSLTLVHLDQNKQIAENTLPTITIKNRLQIVDYGITILHVQFQSPGRYDFRLFANNEFIGNKDFVVIQAKQPAQHSPNL